MNSFNDYNSLGFKDTKLMNLLINDWLLPRRKKTAHHIDNSKYIDHICQSSKCGHYHSSMNLRNKTKYKIKKKKSTPVVIFDDEAQYDHDYVTAISLTELLIKTLNNNDFIYFCFAFVERRVVDESSYL